MGLNLHHVCIDTKMCVQSGNRCDLVFCCSHGHLICCVLLLWAIPCLDLLALGQNPQPLAVPNLLQPKLIKHKQTNKSTPGSIWSCIKSSNGGNVPFESCTDALCNVHVDHSMPWLRTRKNTTDCAFVKHYVKSIVPLWGWMMEDCNNIYFYSRGVTFFKWLF